MTHLDELRLMTKVAHLYHQEGLPQRQIAERLDLSQATISRLLKRALQEEIVAKKRENPSSSDELILLEHEPVYTIGRTPDQSSLSAAGPQLASHCSRLRRADANSPRSAVAKAARASTTTTR